MMSAGQSGSQESDGPSCDTVTFLANGTTSGSGVNGWLKGGTFTQTGGFAVARYTNLTHTDDSYLLYSRANLSGIWGPSGGGNEACRGAPTTSPRRISSPARPTRCCSTAATEARRATLINGVYSQVGSAADFSSGWTIMVGGR